MPILSTAEPKISIVVPLKRLNAYVRENLDHLQRQTYRNFDVYVITDEPETCETHGLDVHFLSSGPVPPNIKRMMAAQKSTAEIVALIDDDAYPAPGWLAAAVKHFVDPHVVAVGGPGVTPPADSSAKQASGAVYASRLVSAGYVYRYLPAAQRDVDDFPSCNLIVRREAFLRYVPECLRYWPGEDTKLCLLLTRGESSRIVYDPEVTVFHHRRDLFWGHFKQVWNYSVHRGFFAKRYPETSMRPQYFVPTLFMLANVGAVAMLLGRCSRPVVLAGTALYGAAVLASATGSGATHRASFPMVAAGIYLTHMTYGIGFLSGLLRPELDH